jgi:Ca2+-binding EF-hand superfamily protein
MIQEADVDGNGEISFDEFKKIVHWELAMSLVMK